VPALPLVGDKKGFQMKTVFNSIIKGLTLALLFLTACRPVPQSSDDTVNVLASTTFLADIAGHVAGDRLKVDSLLPFGADPHAYQAAPSDVAKIAESDLLILNGLEYEHFIESLLENAGGERIIIEATTDLEPHQMDEHSGESGSSEDHEAGDPHMWLDPNLVITYVKNIRNGLMDVDPEGLEVYAANADAYIEELEQLDVFIREQVETIPVQRRLLVTNHEAMGYFAERYDFTVIGAVIPSLSSDAGTSAQEMAALVDLIKSSAAPAIFLGELENPDLADQIAEETGVKVVHDLYLESLTQGAPAGTYIDMMKHNVTQIVNALK
jgi:ABC-type Zn uptake system ZnuABC Zn-binding protein ZnuA